MIEFFIFYTACGLVVIAFFRGYLADRPSIKKPPKGYAWFSWLLIFTCWPFFLCLVALTFLIEYNHRSGKQ